MCNDAIQLGSCWIHTLHSTCFAAILVLSKADRATPCHMPALENSGTCFCILQLPHQTLTGLQQRLGLGLISPPRLSGVGMYESLCSVGGPAGCPLVTCTCSLSISSLLPLPHWPLAGLTHRPGLTLDLLCGLLAFMCVSSLPHGNPTTSLRALHAWTCAREI